MLTGKIHLVPFLIRLLRHIFCPQRLMYDKFLTPVCFLSSSLLLVIMMTACYTCVTVIIKIPPGYL